MKKQDSSPPTGKLLFDKEKVTNLTPDDLDQIQGGQGDTDYYSSCVGFTCNTCTVPPSGEDSQ